jgi:heat shock protein HtpX
MIRNTFKTYVLMAALGGVLVLAGRALGPMLFRGDAHAGTHGMYLFLFIAGAMNFASYWWSDKIVLKLTKSRPVSEAEAPWLYRIVRELAQKANMPMPKLYVMPAAQPNAFATGRNPEHAAVAVTEGILNVLSEEELAGVLAHEISHVHNRDILVGAVAATIAAAITMLARMAMWGAIFGGGGRDDDRDSGPFGAIAMLLSFILAPIAAFMIQMAVSRSREAEADAAGARLLGDATPLANALIKVDAAAKAAPPMDVNPAVSHLFLQSPFKAPPPGRGGSGGSGRGGPGGAPAGGLNFAKLFMSHPPLEERLARLRELGARV